MPQKTEVSRYYMFPTKEELENIRQSGISMVDAENIISIIVKSFAPLREQTKFRAYIPWVVHD
jgi:hypothetical protein